MHEISVTQYIGLVWVMGGGQCFTSLFLFNYKIQVRDLALAFSIGCAGVPK